MAVPAISEEFNDGDRREYQNGHWVYQSVDGSDRVFGKPLVLTTTAHPRVDIENANRTATRQQEAHDVSGKHPKPQVATHVTDNVDAEGGDFGVRHG
jgi:hypothetical protein